MNAAHYYLTLSRAAEIAYEALPKGWRQQPVVDEIAALDEREERRRDAEHPGASNTDNHWGSI